MITIANNRAHRTRNRKLSSIIRYITLAIIAIAMLSVILATLFAIFYNPENIVKQKIAEISSDYYENYLYEKALAPTDTQSTAELAERYVKAGFPIISLRQLFLFDNGRYAESSDLITTHCNESETFITFFPEAPFSKTDYRVEYHYACAF